MTEKLNIISWNCRSLRNKYLELLDFLNTNNVGLCFLSETWLSHSVIIPQMNYHLVRRDRSERVGRGVAILIKKDIKNFKPLFIETKLIENVGVSLKTSDNTIINLFAVYFPGSVTNSDTKNAFKRDIRKLLRVDNNVIICGDLNSRYRNWNCTRANAWGKLLFETVSFLPYTILHPGTPTFIPTNRNRTPSIIDLIISNITHCITHPTAINALGSDHLPVSFKLDADTCRSRELILDYSKTNWGLFKSLVDKSVSHLPHNVTSVTDKNLINLSVDYLTKCIRDASAISTPRKAIDRNYNQLPFYIRQLLNTRNYYRRLWLRYRNSTDLYCMKLYNDKICSEISKFRNRTWNEKILNLDKASKPFWKITKCLRKKRIFIPPLLENSSIFYTDEEKVNQLAINFLENHRVADNLSNQEHIDMVDTVIDRFSLLDIGPGLNEYVNVNEISTIIKDLKTRKASGLDGVKNNMLKHLPNSAIVYICFIINCCLKLQYFPKTWKTAKVIPILKPNKLPNSVHSYRPISLLSSLSKILEKVIKAKISTFIEHHQILPMTQFGFRPFHSTVHQIKRIYDHIFNGFNKGYSTVLVTLDIEKAFDSVWYNGLLYKLIQYNFPFYLVKIIESFLKNRFYCVCLNDKYSDLFEITSGVPQGSVLGPLLYNIYCSDMPQITGIELAAYADDTCLYSSDKFGQNIVDRMQLALNQHSTYFNRWKIKVNETKTTAVFFSRRRNSYFYPRSQLKMNDSPIQWSNNVKYLGVYIDRKLIFDLHIKKLIEKFKKAKAMLYPIIARKSFLSKENKLILAKAIFQSIILYACPVWGLCAKSHIKKLQICQNKLLKMMLNLPWHFSTKSLHREYNIHLIQDKIGIITERFKLFCSLSDNPLISNLYA